MNKRRLFQNRPEIFEALIYGDGAVRKLIGDNRKFRTPDLIPWFCEPFWKMS